MLLGLATRPLKTTVQSARKMSSVSFQLHKINHMAYESASRSGNSASSPTTLAVFIHGNGLSRGIFRAMIEKTMMLLPSDINFHAISIDLPGHGASARPGFEGYETIGENVPEVASCIIDYKRGIQVDETVLVGHSMGAHVGIIALSKDSSLFSKALLIEPMVHPYPNAKLDLHKGLIESTLRRKVKYPTRQAAIDYFSPRGIFQYWEKRCVEDYVDTGFIQLDPNLPDISICCPPIVEYKNFAADLSEGFKFLSKVHFDKVLVLEGEKSGYLPEGFLQTTTSQLKGTLEKIKDGRHIMQCEMPQKMAHKLVEVICTGKVSSRL